MRTAARCFHAGGGGLEIWIPLHGVRNERVKLWVAESADPVRHHGAAAMRPGPASRDLRASRLGHDVRAKGRIFQSAAGNHEAAGGNKKQGAAPSVHRLILVGAEESGEVFDDEPVELGRDADDYAAEDLDRRNIVRVDRSPTAGASSEEDVFILPICH